ALGVGATRLEWNRFRVRMISRSAQVRVRTGTAGAARGAATSGATGSQRFSITSSAVPAASQQAAANKTLFAVQLTTEPLVVVRSRRRPTPKAWPLRPRSGIAQ